MEKEQNLNQITGKKIRINFSTLYYIIKQYKILSFTVITIILFVSFFEAFYIAVLFPILNSLLNVQTQVPHNFIFRTINKIISLIPISDIIVAEFLFIIILITIKSIMGICSVIFSGYASGKIQYEMQKRLMNKYNIASYEFFLEMKQGELINYTLDSTRCIGNALLVLSRIVLAITEIFALLALLFFTNYKIAIFLVFMGILYNFLIRKITNSISYGFASERLNMRNKQLVALNEFFTGIKHLMIYNTKKRWMRIIDNASYNYMNLYIKVVSWIAAPKHITEFVAYSMMFSAGIYLKVKQPDLFLSNLPAMGVFAMAIIKILPAISSFASSKMELTGYLPDMEKVIGLIERNVTDFTFGRKKFDTLQNSICFEDVYYAHKNRKTLLMGINITFEKNKITAFVGDSGSGKTTIINLLLGLFDPDKGKIKIDGIELCEYDIETWRSKIGFVSQDPFIFHSTILENITFGSSKFLMQDVIEAAKLTNSHDFIMAFPEGYSTMVGEKGMRLSGGQQQRIAITRAIIKKPEIIILDEATSSLDNITEKAIQDAINNISKNHTVIVVAHRLTTVQNANKIAVLKNGLIKEEGNHQQLMDLKGDYWELYNQPNIQ